MNIYFQNTICLKIFKFLTSGGSFVVSDFIKSIPYCWTHPNCDKNRYPTGLSQFFFVGRLDTYTCVYGIYWYVPSYAVYLHTVYIQNIKRAVCKFMYPTLVRIKFELFLRIPKSDLEVTIGLCLDQNIVGQY